MKIQFNFIHKNREKNLQGHDHGRETNYIEKLAINSGLIHISSELKIIIGTISLIVCLLSPYSITAILVAVAMIFFTMYYGKIRWQNYWHMLLIPATFILLSGIVLLIEFSDVKSGLLSIYIVKGYMVITNANLKNAVIISIKAFCCVNCLYMISLSTPMYEIVRVLNKCRVPEVVIELMYFIYRFIFILLDTYHNMKNSADTRLGYMNRKNSYRSFLGICSNLFVISFQKASKSFDAMEARCYRGRLQFLEVERPIKKAQMIKTFIYFLILITSLVMERRYS